MVLEIKDIDEYQKVINGDKIVIDWFATWCGPCKAISPAFAKMESEFPHVSFVKVDIDEIPEAAEEADISSMPTFHVYKYGQKIDEVVGAVPAKLRELIQKHNVVLPPRSQESSTAVSSAVAETVTATEVSDAQPAVSDSERIVALEKEVKKLKERLLALEDRFADGNDSKKRKLDN
ncbi:UNVERIFIED_CONTAM: hypothetical protein HDU68_001317 [Siphonaria sp. JEL0065]|nr:hypothetical protein HDU68_001317 [Siphonaria sp. JEL0065]